MLTDLVVGAMGHQRLRNYGLEYADNDGYCYVNIYLKSKAHIKRSEKKERKKSVEKSIDWQLVLCSNTSMCGSRPT